MNDALALAQKFVNGENVYDVEASIWIAAFQYIDKHLDVLPFNRSSIHLIWTESGGHLRNKIRDDQLILRVLRASLPRYQGPGLTLYRGECKFLYEQGKVGFCWTPAIEVAKKFASGLNSLEPGGGALLKAFAPSEAILAGPNDHSTSQMQEFEHTCDPTALKDIELVQTFPKLR